MIFPVERGEIAGEAVGEIEPWGPCRARSTGVAASDISAKMLQVRSPRSQMTPK